MPLVMGTALMVADSRELANGKPQKNQAGCLVMGVTAYFPYNGQSDLDALRRWSRSESEC